MVKAKTAKRSKGKKKPQTKAKQLIYNGAQMCEHLHTHHWVGNHKCSWCGTILEHYAPIHINERHKMYIYAKTYQNPKCPFSYQVLSLDNSVIVAVGDLLTLDSVEDVWDIYR